MEIWHYWVIAGILLLIMEILTPGFVMAVIGLACFWGAAAHLMGYGLTGQVVGFAAGLLLGFVIIRPFFIKYLYPKDKKTLTNREALVGKTGLVIQSLDSETQTGRVRIGGIDWQAVSLDSDDLAKDTRVRVQRVEGATLYVEALKD